jgi:hypothetical protein
MSASFSLVRSGSVGCPMMGSNCSSASANNDEISSGDMAAGEAVAVE